MPHHDERFLGIFGAGFDEFRQRHHGVFHLSTVKIIKQIHAYTYAEIQARLKIIDTSRAFCKCYRQCEVFQRHSQFTSACDFQHIQWRCMHKHTRVHTINKWINQWNTWSSSAKGVSMPVLMVMAMRKAELAFPKNDRFGSLKINSADTTAPSIPST